MNPALARQFGMAVNTQIVAGDVQPGTAHAVGYDPQLVVDLMDVRTAVSEKTGGRFVREIDRLDEARGRVILDEFDRLIAAELCEADAALEGLGDVLYGRRLDIVIPEGFEEIGVPILRFELPSIPAGSAMSSSAHVWRRTGAGLLTALTPRSIDPHHPLHKRNLEEAPGNLMQHTVQTATEALVAQVTQAAVYETRFGDPQLGRSISGYKQTARKRNTTEHAAVYDIPAGAHTAMDYAANRTDRQQLAHQLDPRDNAEWRGRLS